MAASPSESEAPAAGLNKRLLDMSRDGNLEEVKRLLAAGADSNASMPLGDKTPLYVAAANGHIEIVKVLLAAGATISKAISKAIR